MDRKSLIHGETRGGQKAEWDLLFSFWLPAVARGFFIFTKPVKTFGDASTVNALSVSPLLFGYSKSIFTTLTKSAKNAFNTIPAFPKALPISFRCGSQVSKSLQMHLPTCLGMHFGISCTFTLKFVFIDITIS